MLVRSIMKARGRRKMRTRPRSAMGLRLHRGTGSLAGHPLASRVEKLLPHCTGINEEPVPSEVGNQTCDCGTRPRHVPVLSAIPHRFGTCWCSPPAQHWGVCSPHPRVLRTHHPLVRHPLGEHLVEPPAFSQDGAKHQGGSHAEQAETNLRGAGRTARGLTGQPWGSQGHPAPSHPGTQQRRVGMCLWSSGGTY